MFVKTHKDKEQLSSNNNVVYKVSCKNCDASYVGQTKKQLKTRLKEHRNNIKLDQSKHSVISEHTILRMWATSLIGIRSGLWIANIIIKKD